MQLVAKTVHQATGWLGAVQLALNNDPMALRKEIAELEYLDERIKNIQDKTVTRETWQVCCVRLALLARAFHALHLSTLSFTHVPRSTRTLGTRYWRCVVCCTAHVHRR